MASADFSVDKAFATIESDSTQRTVTLSANWTTSDGKSPRHFVLTNIGANSARIGVAGQTLDAAGTGTNSNGQCDLQAGQSAIIDRSMTSFVHKSGSGTTLRLTSGAG